MRIFFTTMIMAALSLPSLAGAGQQIKFISEFTVDAPLDVAAAEGKLYVLLKSGDAVVFTEDGKPLFKLEGKDKEGKPVLKEPSGITIWGDTLYLADSGLDCVVMFKKDGGYRESFGGSGGDPKEFDDPAGIFVHGGVIYVADSGNGRVQVFGSNGVYLRSVGKGGSGEGVLKKPVDVAVDFQGDIYVVDAGDRVVKIYGTDGIYKGKLSGVTLPGPIAMADDGIYLADREKCNVTKFAFDGQKLFSFGIMGEGRVRFRDISGIFALPDGKLYVSDSKNSSLQVLLPEQGKKVAALDRVPPAASVKWMGEVQVSARKIHWDAERGELYAVDDKGGEIRVLGDGEVRRTLKLLREWPPPAWRWIAMGHSGWRTRERTASSSSTRGERFC